MDGNYFMMMRWLFPFCNLISKNCFQLTSDWKFGNSANGLNCCAKFLNGFSRNSLTCPFDFQPEFPELLVEWWAPHMSSNHPCPIDQFWHIKIQSNTIDLRTRLWGINSTNSVVYIPKSFVLKSIVLGWILIYRNWSITPWNSIKGMTFSGLTCNTTFNGPAFYVLVQLYTVCYYLDSFQEFKEHLLGLL